MGGPGDQKNKTNKQLTKFYSNETINFIVLLFFIDDGI